MVYEKVCIGIDDTLLFWGTFADALRALQKSLETVLKANYVEWKRNFTTTSTIQRRLYHCLLDLPAPDNLAKLLTFTLL
jgi:hypothetical protein